ncbi:hypothetical protein [Phaeocystidibacter luteus]|uniref:Uncharacterized protein n=1 Tax=Phaeocystidibacter luteus TaxID=911197 RepID=A0A6N6RMM6_9FLAO|nr:hypothetical protein [Phaeocystidibacter luteus]KAB2814840.1 hypothetical protein F8C67_03570 [Phaeocystidibacter luteus]
MLRTLYTLGLLSLSLLGVGQDERVDRPLLSIPEEPSRILEEGVVGWSISLDGQWFNELNMIPLRSKTYAREDESKELSEVGLDNFDHWEFRSIKYQNDTLLIWLKFMNSGRFRYPETQQDWEDFPLCHYYVFKQSELPDTLFRLGEITRTSIPLLASGQIKSDDLDDILPTVSSEGQPRDSHPYELIIETQCTSDTSEVRWQIYESHALFDEQRGLINPIISNSKSVLGTDRMFRIAYYACDPKVFEAAFHK